MSARKLGSNSCSACFEKVCSNCNIIGCHLNIFQNADKRKLRKRRRSISTLWLAFQLCSLLERFDNWWNTVWWRHELAKDLDSCSECCYLRWLWRFERDCNFISPSHCIHLDQAYFFTKVKLSVNDSMFIYSWKRWLISLGPQLKTSCSGICPNQSFVCLLIARWNLAQFSIDRVST